MPRTTERMNTGTPEDTHGMTGDVNAQPTMKAFRMVYDNRSRTSAIYQNTEPFHMCRLSTIVTQASVDPVIILNDITAQILTTNLYPWFEVGDIGKLTFRLTWTMDIVSDAALDDDISITFTDSTGAAVIYFASFLDNGQFDRKDGQVERWAEFAVPVNAEDLRFDALDHGGATESHVYGVIVDILYHPVPLLE